MIFFSSYSDEERDPCSENLKEEKEELTGRKITEEIDNIFNNLE